MQTPVDSITEIPLRKQVPDAISRDRHGLTKTAVYVPAGIAKPSAKLRP